ncbi:DEAD/DEAH box helicase [Methylicorpusculum sp.]|uniref:DEAD/DEAH box helicase n=1 Tax=Methylicorpusculum sp. TaxID=2713644 RepID=UPI00272018D8|nr:DEAD/DEAH box helicase [Methylicorpusculum sp.]MDO8846685.1 DEAD/DEAH box helicase [Methylicorpusculum sp.]
MQNISDTTLSPVTFLNFNLDDCLLKATEQMGFKQATEVQAHCIPAALEGKDLWVAAKTGSGKTAAYLLPLLQRLINERLNTLGVSALILAPTRELARQIHKQCQLLAEFTSITSGLITGGDDFKKQSGLFRNDTHIVISTPGRLLELINEGSANLNNISVLVVDEADRMLEMGYGNDLVNIVEQCNKTRQTLFFSATLNPNLKGVARTILNDPQPIYLNGIQEIHSQIHQQMVLADDFDHKQKLLIWLLSNETYGKALVFANTKINVDKLRGPLRGHRLRVGSLHGDMDQSERNKVMNFFREGVITILIATDIAARGLDIEGVDLIINFDLARNATDYVHRIGRTGRAEKEGVAISLINSREWNQLAGIERYLNQRLTRRTIKGMEGHYTGPKKLKSSGKAAGTKKKDTTPEKKPVKKEKVRLRDKKNIGKRRKPSAVETSTETKS